MKRRNPLLALTVPIRIALAVTVSISGTLVLGVEIGKREIRNEYAAPDSIAFYPSAPPETIRTFEPEELLRIVEEYRVTHPIEPETIVAPVASPGSVIVIHEYRDTVHETIFDTTRIEEPVEEPPNSWRIDARRPGDDE